MLAYSISKHDKKLDASRDIRINFYANRQRSHNSTGIQNNLTFRNPKGIMMQ